MDVLGVFGALILLPALLAGVVWAVRHQRRRFDEAWARRDGDDDVSPPPTPTGGLVAPAAATRTAAPGPPPRRRWVVLRDGRARMFVNGDQVHIHIDGEQAVLGDGQVRYIGLLPPRDLPLLALWCDPDTPLPASFRRTSPDRGGLALVVLGPVGEDARDDVEALGRAFADRWVALDDQLGV